MSDVKGETLHTLAVEAQQAGTRLDRFLADSLPTLSRSRLKALIEAGQVGGADGPVTDASRKVRAGESFVITVPPAEPAVPAAQDLSLTVVYEDDQVIVIDKPAGLVVHPAAGNPDRTLVNALLHHCGESLAGVGGVRRPGIVHRLDKDTSGLLIAAKTDTAHASLSKQFAEHSIVRAYRAVCWGVPFPAEGEIAGSIGRSSSNRKKMAVVRQGGKEALTRYRLLKPFGTAAALIECRLATGRTHQIRVHLTSIGHPLIGDPLYGHGRAFATALPTPIRPLATAFPRQALHAFLLGFHHPTLHNLLTFESKIPHDINALILSLDQL
jgi:23S rRNA pseudouridine1911/1915/1917 synthase